MWVEIDKRFSEITGAAIGETYKKYVGGIALGRPETPDDVAAFVSYLGINDTDATEMEQILEEIAALGAKVDHHCIRLSNMIERQKAYA